MTKISKFLTAVFFFSFLVFSLIRLNSTNSLRVDAHECKSLNSECDINNSQKQCCPGLTCMDHGVPSNNGKCQLRLTNTPTATPTDHQCHHTPTPTRISTVTPTITPTVTTTPIPTQTPELTVTPVPTATETITGTPVPTATSVPSTDNGGNNGGSDNPGPPVCNASDPGAPGNLRATALGGGRVKLTWDPAPGTHTTYAVAYGPSIGNYLYGDPNVGNVTSYTVLALNPGGNYCFYVQAQNDCRGGNPSNVVCTNQGVGSFRVLGASDNYNPLVDGIKESYGGEILGDSTELMGTAEVVYSNNKLPSGNTLLEGQSISIPAIGLNQPLYQPQLIASQLAVGQHEVLNTTVDGSDVYYGHNGYDVFGSLYQAVKGNQILVTKNNQKLVYTITSTEFVKKDNTAVLQTSADQIVLVTCSFTQPDYRIVVKASLQK